MRTIFIIMDSLNRHYLRCYGNEFAITPNINRLAQRGTVFDNHFAGSLPCMPARREMLTGRVNFLETPWSPVQPWDECLPTMLREQRGVYSHMITDHYHYFHSGGEGYNTIYSSWEFLRGQEGDTWRPLVEEPPKPEGARGLEGPCRWGYWRNQTYAPMERDEDYSTPRASSAPWTSSSAITMRRTGTCTWRCSTRTSRSTVRRATASGTATAGTATTSPGRCTAISIPSSMTRRRCATSAPATAAR